MSFQNLKKSTVLIRNIFDETGHTVIQHVALNENNTVAVVQWLGSAPRIREVLGSNPARYSHSHLMRQTASTYKSVGNVSLLNQ